MLVACVFLSKDRAEKQLVVPNFWNLIYCRVLLIVIKKTNEEGFFINYSMILIITVTLLSIIQDKFSSQIGKISSPIYALWWWTIAHKKDLY